MGQVPSGFAEVLIPFRHSGLARAAACVYGIDNNTGLSSPSAIADGVIALWEANIQDLIDTEVTVGPAHVRVNNGAGVISGDGTDSFAGTLADQTVAPNTAILVQKSSSTPGRAGRGRLYLPWAATDDSTNELGVLDPAAVIVIQGAFSQLLADHGTFDAPMVILHSGAGTPAEVEELTVQGLLATQRRRMRP